MYTDLESYIQVEFGKLSFTKQTVYFSNTGCVLINCKTRDIHVLPLSTLNAHNHKGTKSYPTEQGSN